MPTILFCVGCVSITMPMWMNTGCVQGKCECTKMEDILEEITMLKKYVYAEGSFLVCIGSQALKFTLDCENLFEFSQRKFKGGICCGSHLAVTYGGDLLYLQIFLAFPAWTQIIHAKWLLRGESCDNSNMRSLRRMITPNPKVQ